MDAAAVKPGLLQGKFIFKKLPSGDLDKNKAICTLCKAEFVYCRSSTSLKYHLKAKHPGAIVKHDEPRTSTVAPGGKRRVRQTTMFECTNRGTPISETLSEKLTNLLARWIAINCRPISVVEDEGLQLILQVAMGDPSYKLPARQTIVRRIHDEQATQRAVKEEKLAGATCVALTGDHWTSPANENYLGVTAHLIDISWELHSFALGM